MAEYLVTDTDMTTVANAIRTRGGTSEQLSFPNGMATAIANIDADGGWVRPAEWGERPAEFTAEKALPKASRTMDAVYLLYHNEQNLDALHRLVGLKVRVSSGTYKMERGYMVGTTFTVEETVSGIASDGWYEVELGNVSREYVLFKITPEAEGAYITYVTRGWSDSSSVRSQLKCCFLEAYGRLKVSTYRTLGGGSSIFSSTTFIDILTYGGGAFATYNMFYANGYTECIDSSDYEFESTTGMYSMFYCTTSNLTTLYTSGWDTSNVMTMSRAFMYCPLTSLDVSGWDTGAVTNMQQMFDRCSKLTALNVSGWDTGAVTNMGGMFSGCSKLTALNVSGWDTGAVTDMGYMFSDCSKLTALNVSGWDTGAVTNMGYMFQNCFRLTSLDVSGWDTGAVTNMGYMFQNCYRLTSLDVSGWDTGAVTNMQQMFDRCYQLVTLDLSGWDMSNVTNMSSMFANCTALMNVTGGAFRLSVSFANSSFLTHASAVSIINALATVDAQTITFHSNTGNLLTQAEIDVATNKGWSVVW